MSPHLEKCLKIVFSYLKEYAGLSAEKGSPDVLVGQLYDYTSRTVKAESRVSVSIEGETYHVRDTLAYEISKAIHGNPFHFRL